MILRLCIKDKFMQIKQVLKYSFPIYLKLNYMLQFLIVLISILISLLKLCLGEYVIIDVL